MVQGSTNTDEEGAKRDMSLPLVRKGPRKVGKFASNRSQGQEKISFVPIVADRFQRNINDFIVAKITPFLEDFAFS